MNKLLNIAEILQDCPKGTELYSTICGKCFLSKIYPHLGIDVISEDNITYNFLYDGRFTIMGECMLFPSKDQRDWSKWHRPFLKGDILVSEKGNIVLCSHIDEEQVVHYHCILNFWGNFEIYNGTGVGYSYNCNLANNSQKQRLFDALKKEGYEWDDTIKTLKKLIEPKFKVGDTIREKNGVLIYKVTNVTSEYYSVEIRTQEYTCTGVLPVKDQDDFELIEKKTFDFGKALTLLKEGKLVSREGWNGKKMFVFMRPSDNLSKDFIIEKVKSLPKSFKDFVTKYPFKDNNIKFNSYLCLKSANDEIINGWSASQTDMLAEDWFEIIP
jgi:hypothetical protein